MVQRNINAPSLRASDLILGLGLNKNLFSLNQIFGRIDIKEWIKWLCGPLNRDAIRCLRKSNQRTAALCKVIGQKLQGVGAP